MCLIWPLLLGKLRSKSIQMKPEGVGIEERFITYRAAHTHDTAVKTGMTVQQHFQQIKETRGRDIRDIQQMRVVLNGQHVCSDT